ncbi:hypothetical protein BDR26DRAFT_920804 [Obelidium mucronatum]|nr:hypothetical protein BDR26DRAFT_920804 [Obelidium mucronatum]
MYTTEPSFAVREDSDCSSAYSHHGGETSDSDADVYEPAGETQRSGKKGKAAAAAGAKRASPNANANANLSAAVLRPTSTTSTTSTLPFFGRGNAHNFIAAEDGPPIPIRSDGSRKRVHPTREQQTLLEAFFERNAKPGAAERADICKAVNINSRSVQVWFQNRRAKLKKGGSDFQGYAENIESEIVEKSQRPSPPPRLTIQQQQQQGEQHAAAPLQQHQQQHQLQTPTLQSFNSPQTAYLDPQPYYHTPPQQYQLPLPPQQPKHQQQQQHQHLLQQLEADQQQQQPQQQQQQQQQTMLASPTSPTSSPSNNTNTASQSPSRVFISEVRIGTWRRVATTHESLICEISPFQGILRWSLIESGFTFRFEVLLMTVMDVSIQSIPPPPPHHQQHQDSSLSVVTLDLCNAPSFYRELMDPQGQSTNMFAQCSDFTEGVQGSTVLRHEIHGETKEMEKLFDLLSEYFDTLKREQVRMGSLHQHHGAAANVDAGSSL